jgi:hypothetical protein
MIGVLSNRSHEVPEVLSIILANVLQEEREREIRRRFRHVSGVPTGPRHPETTTERKTVAGQLRPAVTSGAVGP